MKPHVFISYVRENAADVERISKALSSVNIDVWIDRKRIKPGQRWRSAIRQAIEEGAFFIACFSSESTARDRTYMNEELTLAVDELRKRPIDRAWFIPVLLSKVKIPDRTIGGGETLNDLQWVDLSSDWDDGIRQIVEALAPPPSAPTALTAPDIASQPLKPPQKPSLTPSPKPAPTGHEMAIPGAEPFRTRGWEMLMRSIAEGSVVPVVGPELLEVTILGRRTQLYEYLAKALGQHLNIRTHDLAGPEALAETAGYWIAETGDPSVLYSTLKDLFPNSDQIDIPGPLRQLARIQPLNLFVTTSFDPFMQMALDSERYGGRGQTTVLSSSLLWDSVTQDLDQEIAALRSPLVYHLFGRLSALHDYAITEEDILETVHLLGSRERGPVRLLDELARRQILFLGGNLAEPILRSLLALLQGTQPSRRRGVIVADSRLRDSVDFRKYRHYSSARPYLYLEGGAVEFVNELSARWTEFHSSVISVPLAAPRNVPTPGVIYISFAPEDAEIAGTIAKALDHAGLDVWLGGNDESEMNAMLMRRYIERCAVFIPILSRHSISEKGGRLQAEWRAALQAAERMPPSTRFIMPMVIDDTSPESTGIPEPFCTLPWIPFDRDRVDSDLVPELTNLVRSYRKLRAD